jgi:S1-C subfamily serine protease
VTVIEVRDPDNRAGRACPALSENTRAEAQTGFPDRLRQSRPRASWRSLAHVFRRFQETPVSAANPRPLRPIVLLGAVLAAGLIALVSAFAGARLADHTPSAPQAVRAAAASVVTLYAERPSAGLMQFDPAAGPTPEPQTQWRWRTASGFAFAPGGWIVTNHHAVAGARRIEARLADGRRVTATPHGADPRRDLAVVRLEGAAPAPLRPARTLRIGDPVFALGAPFDLSGSLSAGVIGGFDRAYDGVDPVGYLQHDAALNPGNSGGPLVDRQGRVAGLNTAIAEPAIMNVGVSFAIPASLVFGLADQIRTEGSPSPARLGLSVRTLDPALAEAMALDPGAGLIVDAVEPDTPAEAAGLAPGDVLLSLDGAAMGLPRDLNRVLLERRPGESVTLVWRSAGARLESRIPLDAAPVQDRASSGDGRSDAASSFGLRFEHGAPETGEHGARVAQVLPGSPASMAGLRPGDHVLAVNGRRIADGVEAALRLHEAGQAAALRIQHPGEREARHVGLARAASGALSAPGQVWPDAAGGPY